ncbi:hypothetical protein GWK47_040023 [Chionoecetes opilio]|uniref:Uncharacterized protein n=1 Tax=Chionoecetes opilio TaxID=41210 RepID=A0A8J4YK99_CHIOP|nr:hypothetical protein GWK47_040023 [Chionoecetes opilio]
MRNNPLTPELKFIITLGYLATGKPKFVQQRCPFGPFHTPQSAKPSAQTIDALCQHQCASGFRCKVQTIGYPCQVAGLSARFTHAFLNDSGVTHCLREDIRPQDVTCLEIVVWRQTWLLTPNTCDHGPGHQSRYNMGCLQDHTCIAACSTTYARQKYQLPVDEEYDVVGEAEDDVGKTCVVRAPRAVPSLRLYVTGDSVFKTGRSSFHTPDEWLRICNLALPVRMVHDFRNNARKG